jgi:hypothetical protein
VPTETPLHVFEWTNTVAGDVMVDRNLKGRDLEAQGREEPALVLYEANLQDFSSGTHPYDRLRIIYTRRAWYTDAIRACDTYLALPDRPAGQDKPHFQKHRDKLLPKVAK